MSSTTSSGPPAATTSGNANGNSPGPTSSPLLFFVALGFGVVFTNLWIIVGVKYCFRYNQRNRQLRNGEDGEPIDLGAMPRAHRRRREKKLMTMDEVNERFPLTKYKQWMTSRAAEGLPTAGGINTASSRPATLHNVEGISKEIDKSEKSTDATSSSAIRPILTATDTSVTDPTDPQHGSPEITDDGTTPPEHSGAPEVRVSIDRPSTAKSAVTHTDAATKTETNDDAEGEDEEDQIQTAVPTEQLPDPGDSCAICLDTIDEDDDIRGLTCGHAFHASCVDPWLTSRRACCPLCKADYYVPKPRPEGADAESATGRRTRGGNMPAAPQYAFMGAGRGGVNPFGGRRPSMVLPGRFMTIVYNENDRYGFPTVVREPRPSRAERRAAMRRASSVAFDTDADTAAAEAIAQARNQQQNAPPPWRQRLFGNLRLPRSHTERRNEGQQESGTTGPSPGQLEAGGA